MSQRKVIVILEDIRSALNVGAMFRTADGAGVTELVLAGITPYPPHNRIPKTALGAVEHVSWKHYRDKREALDYVTQDQGLPLIAVETGDNAIYHTEYEYPEEVALIFGNEIGGVSDEALHRAQARVMIPMLGFKESLNVATSFGIIVYEIARQHAAYHSGKA
ncbi:MAG: tRNA (guanosine(18)-2'-O)-methyltransferase [candidate division WS6 bacterium OLB20]|uniref:tRNA (Guanosine(18)-2'-O)-methyltransferase n=1 Tax=candidate division WS6 bacterium OLB20 TaxID=1617426 RepID=A0A136LY24_9BACT|nr:MAG: tRNA (guanosine(18)-2'-O)-methyltransferase [candidate division WS6 bacterium OLB20]